MVVILEHPAGYSQSFFALRRDRNFMVSLGSGTATTWEMVNPASWNTKPNIAMGAEIYLPAGERQGRADVVSNCQERC